MGVFSTERHHSGQLPQAHSQRAIGFGKRVAWSAGAKGIHIPIVKTGHEAGERVLSVRPPAGRRSLPIYYGFITLHALSSGSRSRPSRSSGEAHKVTEAICEICSKIVKFARDLVGRAHVFQLYLASPLPGTTYRMYGLRYKTYSSALQKRPFVL